MATRHNHGNQFVDENGIYDELAELRNKVHSLQRTFDELSNEEQAHLRAKQLDARSELRRGETATLVVLESAAENDGTHAVSKIEGIYTFIDVGPYQLDRGDVVHSRIVDIGDNHAEAVVLEPLSQGVDDD